MVLVLKKFSKKKILIPKNGQSWILNILIKKEGFKMTIEKTSDKNFPIAFDDSWGGHAYLNRFIVMDDKRWKEFIAELEKIRNEIKKDK